MDIVKNPTMVVKYIYNNSLLLSLLLNMYVFGKEGGKMVQYLYTIFDLMNFILYISIVLISTVILYRINRKYEIISSVLFLQRKKIKKQIYLGYFSFMLVFTGNLFYNSNSIDLFGSVAHLLVFLGLYIGLFTLFEIYTVIEIVQKNQNPYFLRPN